MGATFGEVMTKKILLLLAEDSKFGNNYFQRFGGGKKSPKQNCDNKNLNGAIKVKRKTNLKKWCDEKLGPEISVIVQSLILLSTF